MKNGAAFRRTAGFRISTHDVVVLIGAAAVSFIVLLSIGTWGWVFLIVPLHFFLFCNVFRIHRYLEYLWSAIFLANTAWWSLGTDPRWGVILAVQTPVTVALIAFEMTRDRYHGVGARRINARLDEYLKGGSELAAEKP